MTDTAGDDRSAQRRAWLGYFAMVLGQFIAVLDIQIVASSLNEIQGGLSATPDEIQWVQTAYLIAEVIGIPLSGYLSRALSTRIYFVISALGFTLASAGCALSWSLGSMVVFRVFQGFLGAGMIPTTFAAIYMLFPAERRIMPQVLAGMMTMLAPSLGPTIGGYVTQAMSWHWLFLLNLFPGLMVAAAVWRFIHIDEPRLSTLRDIDLLSLLYMAMLLGGFEYTLDEGPRHDWFDQRSVLVTTIMTVAGGFLFFHRVFTAKHPVVDLRAFRNRNFAIGSAMTLVIGLNLYTLIYITPLFLGEVRGFNPVQIGHIMAVQGIAMFFAAPLVGKAMGFIGPRPMIAFGMATIAFGTWVNSHLTVDAGFWQFFVPQAARGIGIVVCVIPLTDIALGTLPSEEVKNASGLFNLMRNIGGAIGLALIVTEINRRTWMHWQHLAETTRLSREPVREALAATTRLLAPTLGNDAQAGAIGLIVRQMQLQVATMTFNDMYRLLSYAVFASAILVLGVQTPKHAVDRSAAH